MNDNEEAPQTEKTERRGARGGKRNKEGQCGRPVDSQGSCPWCESRRGQVLAGSHRRSHSHFLGQRLPVARCFPGAKTTLIQAPTKTNERKQLGGQFPDHPALWAREPHGGARRNHSVRGAF